MECVQRMHLYLPFRLVLALKGLMHTYEVCFQSVSCVCDLFGLPMVLRCPLLTAWHNKGKVRLCRCSCRTLQLVSDV